MSVSTLKNTEKVCLKSDNENRQPPLRPPPPFFFIAFRCRVAGECASYDPRKRCCGIPTRAVDVKHY